MSSESSITLQIKKEYFDKILSGKKNVEYRLIKKRIVNIVGRNPTKMILINGYKKDSPCLECEIYDIKVEIIKYAVGSESIETGVFAFYIGKPIKVR